MPISRRGPVCGYVSLCVCQHRRQRLVVIRMQPRDRPAQHTTCTPSPTIISVLLGCMQFTRICRCYIATPFFMTVALSTLADAHILCMHTLQSIALLTTVSYSRAHRRMLVNRHTNLMLDSRGEAGICWQSLQLVATWFQECLGPMNDGSWRS